MLDLLQEVTRDIKRALVLGDEAAAIRLTRELYKELIRIERKDLAEELFEAMQQGDLGGYINIMESFRHRQLGMDDERFDNARVSFVQLERQAVDLSGYSSMN